MKKELLKNIRRMLALTLSVVLIGSSLQPAKNVFATDGSVAEGSIELSGMTTPAPKGGEMEAASGSALELGEENTTMAALQTIIPDVDLPDNNELFGGYVELNIFGDESPASAYATLAGNRLGTAEKAVYDALKEQISTVAANGGSTEFTVDVTGKGVTYTITQIVDNKASGTYNVNISKIIDALLTDCPYELYWYDKSEGMSYGASLSGSYNVNDVVPLTTLVFYFKVASAYQDAQKETPVYNVSSTMVSAATTAKNNAENVITEANNVTGVYNQLLYCLNYIKDNVAYGDTMFHI